MGSGSTLLSNEEIEANESVRAIGKLAIYTPIPVIEHVIPPKRLTQSWFCRRAVWQAVSDLLSKSELAPDLAAVAPQRLSQKSHEGPLFCPLRSGAALKGDMDLAYCLVVVALCGGAEAMPSPDGAGLARTRTADNIRRLFRLRPASRFATDPHFPRFH
jgi:hypothetical protein